MRHCPVKCLSHLLHRGPVPTSADVQIRADQVDRPWCALVLAGNPALLVDDDDVGDSSRGGRAYSNNHAEDRKWFVCRSCKNFPQTRGKPALAHKDNQVKPRAGSYPIEEIVVAAELNIAQRLTEPYAATKLPVRV